MRSNKYPPMVPGAPSPEQLIGVELADDFKKHYKAANKCNSNDEFNSAMKPLPVFIREKISQAYVLLQSAGWYPVGVDNSGNIKWFYVVDSRTKEMRNMEGRQFTPEEYNLSRAAVHKRMNKSSKTMPKCEPWDFNQAGDNGR